MSEKGMVLTLVVISAVVEIPVLLWTITWLAGR